MELGTFLRAYFPDSLSKRYQVLFSEQDEPWQILLKIAEARSCVTKGGEPDLSRAALFFLDDFRSGRLGKITLEFPPEGE